MEKKKYAFISYNHLDLKLAKWLHQKLESYRLPTEIHNEFEDSRYLRPVFRDQEDLNTGVLSDELRKHLEESKYLVVICSPHSACSAWVSDEVRTFIEWGRLEYIIPFIIDGTPNSGDDQECFPQSLRDYTAAHPDREILGISIAEVGREKAFIKVISRMLGVSFDELWKRHERERRRRLLAMGFASVALISMLYYFALPVTLTIRLSDEKHHLPMPDNAVIEVNGAEYPLENLDTTLTIKGLPGYYKGRCLPVRFSAQWYTTINENLHLGWRPSTHKDLVLQRDSSFAVFAGTVIDEEGRPIEGATLQMEEKIDVTNVEGKFSFTFPVSEQSETKSMEIRREGFKDYLRPDECPSSNITYMLRKE